jgi:hypothetical protein
VNDVDIIAAPPALQRDLRAVLAKHGRCLTLRADGSLTSRPAPARGQSDLLTTASGGLPRTWPPRGAAR